MKKEEFKQGFAYLNVAYNKDFTKEQLDVWYDFFKEDDFENFRNAVKSIILKNKYMPSIAELKTELEELVNKKNTYEIINYINNCGEIENFKTKENFYFDTENEENKKIIIESIKNGLTINEIKEGIYNAYNGLIENGKRDCFGKYRGYEIKSLFGMGGSRILYYINYPDFWREEQE